MNSFCSNIDKRLLELSIACFAVWTVLCNLVVLGGGNLICLCIAAVSTFLLCTPLLFRLWRKSLPMRVRRDQTQLDCLNETAWLLALCIAVVLTLTLNRPDADDAFYVNMAVGAVDNPLLPLLSRDTMHHLTNAPIMLSFYKVHSFELLAAFFSAITKAPAIIFLHVVFPPLAAIMALLAYRSLFRQLTPCLWGFASLATCLFLCANGDVHASYGNLSWVRLHQGKCIFVTAVIPIIIDATIAFAKEPSARGFLYLSAAQIAAVGMTGSALAIAPAVSLLTALASISVRDWAAKPARVLRGVIAACLYPMAVATLVALQSPPATDATMTVDADIVWKNILYVFGSGPFAYACGVIMICTSFLAKHPVARRLGLYSSLFALLVACNPLIVPLLAEKLSVSPIIWRLYWIVPLPLFAGLFCCIPLEYAQSRAVRWPGFAVYAGLLILLLAVLPQKRIFDKSNQTTIGKPGLKVPSCYDDIKEIAAHFASEDSLLLPAELSPWLPTLHRAPRPVLSRLSYAHLYPPDIRDTISSAQQYITEAQSGHGSGEALSSLLHKMEIRGVCFSANLPNAADIVNILRLRGYQRVEHVGSGALELYVVHPSQNKTQVLDTTPQLL